MAAAVGIVVAVVALKEEIRTRNNCARGTAADVISSKEPVNKNKKADKILNIE